MKVLQDQNLLDQMLFSKDREYMIFPNQLSTLFMRMQAHPTSANRKQRMAWWISNSQTKRLEINRGGMSLLTMDEPERRVPLSAKVSSHGFGYEFYMEDRLAFKGIPKQEGLIFIYSGMRRVPFRSDAARIAAEIAPVTACDWLRVLPQLELQCMHFFMVSQSFLARPVLEPAHRFLHSHIKEWIAPR